MKKKLINIPLNISFADVEDINPSFAKSVLRVAYTGKNRNKSNISKKAFEDSIDSIYNVPVVAHYMREEDDFGGHDVELMKKDGTYKLVPLTQPVGVIPESAKWFWEDVEEDDGETHQYFCVEALLWKRQEAFDKIANNEFTSQSMEITVEDFNESDDGYLNIDKFFYTAFTLLGDNVEPCFESAGLEMFSTDNFRCEFEKMLADFKQDMSSLAKEIKMDEKKKLIAQYQCDPENLGFDIEPMSIDELKRKLDAEFELIVTNDNGENKDSGEPENFTTQNTISQWLATAVADIKDDDGYSYLYMVDVQEQNVVTCNWYNGQLNLIPYMIVNDSAVLDVTNMKRAKVEYVECNDESAGLSIISELHKELDEAKESAKAEKETLEASVADVTAKYDAAQAELDNVKEKYTALVDAENARKKAEDDKAKENTFAQFDAELGDMPEYVELKGKEDMNADAVAQKCYELYGKKKFTLNKENKKPVIDIGNPDEVPTRSVYGTLFD